jgi:hypothetical protein
MSKQNFLTTRIQLTENGDVSSNPGIEGAFGESDKIKIISGPMRLYTTPMDGAPQEIIVGSISDIPIAVEAFADFWYRNVISLEREVYSVLDFIRDISDQLIGKAFGEGCAYGIKSAFSGRTSVKTGWVQLPGSDKDPLLNQEKGWYDDITGDLLVEQVDKSLTKPDIKATTTASNLWNYIVIYMENKSDMSEYIGDEAADIRRGIYHLSPARKTVQSVSFQKTDQPFLRETRFMLLGENPLVHLSNVYNVTITMEGNNLFYPGQMVYIDPTSFGTSIGRPVDSNSMSNVMGLGGYHIIMAASHEWSKGKASWTTTIDALWDNNGKKTTRCVQVAIPCSDQENAAKVRSTSGTI